MDWQFKRSIRYSCPYNIESLVRLGHSKFCLCCGTDDDLTVDHITPISKGGTNSPENVQILCEQCNRNKSDKILDILELRELCVELIAVGRLKIEKKIQMRRNQLNKELSSLDDYDLKQKKYLSRLNSSII